MSSTKRSKSERVYVVIVNFNGGELARQALTAVLASSCPVDVAVVDNGSEDGSLEQLRREFEAEARVEIYAVGRNIGFSRANNLALRRNSADWILLLNPDCIIEPTTLVQMQEVLLRFPEVGMAGPLVQDPDGTEQAGARRRVPSPWRALVRAFGLSRLLGKRFRSFRDFTLHREPLPAHPLEVEAISGAFMLVRRRAMEQVGLLDEGYFLHVEDLDWCMRFRQQGWKILFIPSVKVTHYKGTCSRARPVWVQWQMHKGMVRFYRKFFRDLYPAPLMWLVVLGVWLRFSVLALYQLLRHGYRTIRAR